MSGILQTDNFRIKDSGLDFIFIFFLISIFFSIYFSILDLGLENSMISQIVTQYDKMSHDTVTSHGHTIICHTKEYRKF